MGDKLEWIRRIFQPRLGFEVAQRIFGNFTNALEVFIDPSDAILERFARNIPAVAVRGRNLEPPNAPLPDRRTMPEAKQRPKVIGSGVIEIWDRLNTPPPLTGERQ